MARVKDKIADLEARLAELRRMGGEERVAKQRQQGKLDARQRLDVLFDPGTLCELDEFVRHRCTNFGMADKQIAAEGVITGHGLIEGRRVFAFSQDFTSQAGSLGEMHARKICKVMDLALKSGAPLVGLIDSGGARIQEGVDALSGYGEIFFRNARASGVIPQVSAIMGATAGGAVYSPAMTDFVFMVKKSSYMFITGPKVIRAVTGEQIGFEELGGAMVHNTISGVAHFAAEDDADCLRSIRRLLGYLPSNNTERPPFGPSDDPPDRPGDALDAIVPDDERLGYDMRAVILALADAGSWFEVHEHFARNIIVGLCRLGGRAVGVIANQPLVLAGCLDCDASDKATRFIRCCDAFNVPLLTIADVPGYMPGSEQEHMGIIRHGAKLLWCYSEATVPKVTLITRKVYGGSYLAMCSKHQGADLVLAWPTAEVAVMGAEGAADVLYAKEIEAAPDPQKARAAKLAEYRELFYSPYIAAERGYIDKVIRPSESRRRIVEAFDMLADKRDVLPPKKHGNIPV